MRDRPKVILGPGHEPQLLVGRAGSGETGLRDQSVEPWTQLGGELPDPRQSIAVALPDGLTSDQIRPFLVGALLDVRALVRKSLTWDRGREVATHRQLTAESGCPVYFCAPRSPWQRGTNENTNRPLRQYLGKGADLNALSQTDLTVLAARINNRPRKVLA